MHPAFKNARADPDRLTCSNNSTVSPVSVLPPTRTINRAKTRLCPSIAAVAQKLPPNLARPALAAEPVPNMIKRSSHFDFFLFAHSATTEPIRSANLGGTFYVHSHTAIAHSPPGSSPLGSDVGFPSRCRTKPCKPTANHPAPFVRQCRRIGKTFICGASAQRCLGLPHHGSWPASDTSLAATRCARGCCCSHRHFGQPVRGISGSHVANVGRTA